MEVNGNDRYGTIVGHVPAGNELMNRFRKGRSRASINRVMEIRMWSLDSVSCLCCVQQSTNPFIKGTT